MSGVVVETHVSRLFFSPDRVYKFLKPLRFPFLDHSTVEARAAAIRRELELNRRFAPDVYLGCGVVREGEVVTDHFLVLKRLAEERRLSTLVAAGDAEAHIRDVARCIATFHAGLAPIEAAAAVASPASERKRWDDNLSEMAELGAILPSDDLGRAATLAHRYLDGRVELLERRITDGYAREGHGDLLADDIFCLDDGPRILDCLAFDESLRLGDVLADVAFLAMDLERIGGPADAGSLLDFYSEFSNEHHPNSLAHHYVAYRALVRAKIAALGAATDRARAMLAMTLRHLRKARIRMIVVGGTPGTGKTTLAEALGADRGWTVLSTDEVRKELEGISYDQHAYEEPGRGIYGHPGRIRVYRELVSRAAKLARMGESVVLDGSWTRREWRTLAREAARECYADMVELRCDAPTDVARSRLLSRGSTGPDPSDATPEVADFLSAEAEPWPAALAVDTTRPLERCLDELNAELEVS